MSDIVDELRDKYPETILFTDIKHIAHEAAETIERLRESTLRLEGQLADTQRLLAESRARERALREYITPEQHRFGNVPPAGDSTALDAAIAKAKREENEACAKICEVMGNNGYSGGWSIAKAIRCRMADELKGGEQG